MRPNRDHSENENRPDPSLDSTSWVNQSLLDGGHAIREVNSGANPDRIDNFFPQQNIEQDPGKGSSTGAGFEAFFSQPRRSGK